MAEPPHETEPVRSLHAWLSDAAIPSSDRHALVATLGRWFRAKQADLDQTAAWTVQTIGARRGPDGWRIEPLPPSGIAASRGGRAIDEELRLLVRSLDYADVPSSEVLRFVRAYFDGVGMDWREQRVLLRTTYAWLGQWLTLTKRSRRRPMAWPADLPLSLHDADRAADDASLHRPFDRPPSGENVERFDKAGLSADRVRARLRAGDRHVFVKWGRGEAAGMIAHEHAVLRRLLAFGVPATRPLGFSQQASADGETSTLTLAEVPGEALDRWLAGSTKCGLPRADELSPAQRHRLARAVGRLLGQLHGADVFHRDAYLCHIFVSVQPDGELALRWIDLGRALVDPWCRRRWAVKDLAALLFSSRQAVSGQTLAIGRTDRLRVLTAYLQTVAPTQIRSRKRRLQRSRWQRQVERKARAIETKDARRTARARRASA